jgi:tryptophan synthase alpha chain
VSLFCFEKFCKKCVNSRISGTIIPEMMVTEFNKNYKTLYSKHNMSSVFMITPQTREERIKTIDESSNGFSYLISFNSITGTAKNIQEGEDYFKRIQKMKLTNPSLIGFNINTKEDCNFASKFSNGAIIGTAFIKIISEGVEEEKIKIFMTNFHS